MIFIILCSINLDKNVHATSTVSLIPSSLLNSQGAKRQEIDGSYFNSVVTSDSREKFLELTFGPNALSEQFNLKTKTLQL